MARATPAHAQLAHGLHRQDAAEGAAAPEPAAGRRVAQQPPGQLLPQDTTRATPTCAALHDSVQDHPDRRCPQARRQRARQGAGAPEPPSVPPTRPRWPRAARQFVQDAHGDGLPSPGRRRRPSGRSGAARPGVRCGTLVAGGECGAGRSARHARRTPGSVRRHQGLHGQVRRDADGHLPRHFPLMVSVLPPPLPCT
ncbi:hypothetical protein FOCC_FOCC017159 [Frankliniella occidentalis]|nr:hypothetical protein FOCC_FOCC017159 [Frankliniella occidentalis]